MEQPDPAQAVKILIVEDRVGGPCSGLAAERDQAAEELRLEKMLVQERHAVLREMMDSMAHQWKQPLNAIGLLIQDIALSYEYGNLSRSELDFGKEKIMDLVGLLSQTFDDFRSVFAPERGIVEFDVVNTVAQALSILEVDLSRRGIRTQLSALDLDASIVTGSLNDFFLVLLSILNHVKGALSVPAIDDPFIFVSIHRENGKLVITVTDNAGGIPEEILERIFEPNFTVKEQWKGFGTGLYISKNIVEQNMNGSLTVRNTGLGAEFRIEV